MVARKWKARFFLLLFFRLTEGATICLNAVSTMGSHIICEFKLLNARFFLPFMKFMF